MRIEHLQTQDEHQAVIGIEGLERPLTLMHITDNHVVAADQRDPKALEITEQRQRHYQELSPGGVPPQQLFEQAMARSNHLAVDCTILTGDIIDFPARAAVEILERGVNGLRSSYLYTLGNHDWHFPHMEWNDTTREQYYPRLAHLAGNSPAAQVLQRDGVRLIALDNSNYQITDQQLDFLRCQLQTGEPCLLFVHIPLYLAALMPAVLKKWNAPIAMATPNWPEESRNQWLVRESDASTIACHDLLTRGEADNLVGIFCGHVHLSHAGEIRPGRYQYVTTEGFRNGYRIIRLNPL